MDVKQLVVSCTLLLTSVVFAFDVNVFNSEPHTQPFDFFCGENIVIDSNEVLAVQCPINGLPRPQTTTQDTTPPESMMRGVESSGLDLNVLLDCLRHHTPSECEDRGMMEPVHVNVVVGSSSDYIHECPYDFDECDFTTKTPDLNIWMFVRGGVCPEVRETRFIVDDVRSVTAGLTSLAGTVQVITEPSNGPITLTLEVVGGDTTGKGWLVAQTRDGPVRTRFIQLPLYSLHHLNDVLGTIQFEAQPGRSTGAQTIRATVEIASIGFQDSDDLLLQLPPTENVRVGVGDEVIVPGGTVDDVVVAPQGTISAEDPLTTVNFSLDRGGAITDSTLSVSQTFTMDNAQCVNSEITLLSGSSGVFIGANDFNQCTLTCRPGVEINFQDESVLRMIGNSQLILVGCTVRGGTLDTDTTSVIDATDSTFLGTVMDVDGPTLFDDTTIRDGALNLNDGASADVDDALNLQNTDLTVTPGVVVDLTNNGVITADPSSSVNINDATFVGGELNVNGPLNMNDAVFDGTRVDLENTQNTNIAGLNEFNDGSVLQCIDSTLNNVQPNPNPAGRLQMDSTSGMVGLRCTVVGGILTNDGLVDLTDTTIRDAQVNLRDGSTTTVDDINLQNTLVSCSRDCTIQMNDANASITGDATSRLAVDGTILVDSTPGTRTIGVQTDLGPNGTINVQSPATTVRITADSTLDGDIVIAQPNSSVVLGGTGHHTIGGTVSGSGTLRVDGGAAATLRPGADVRVPTVVGFDFNRGRGVLNVGGAAGTANIRGPLTVDGQLRVGPNGNLLVQGDTTVSGTGEVVFVFGPNGHGSIANTGAVNAQPGSQFLFDVSGTGASFAPPNGSNLLTFWTANNFNLSDGAWPTTTLSLPGFPPVNVNLGVNGNGALDALLGGTLPPSPTPPPPSPSPAAPTGGASIPIPPPTTPTGSTSGTATGTTTGTTIVPATPQPPAAPASDDDGGSPVAAIVVPTTIAVVVLMCLGLGGLLWWLFHRDSRERDYKDEHVAYGQPDALDMMGLDMGQKTPIGNGVFAPAGTPHMFYAQPTPMQ
eukprot:TRINITY_DN65830_c3_g2_i1.p1 TRINITY_DN65830_c3_g2~~TRINITY_DN65830_c3_g2_i1.p1  ORF type:complete len:1047 (+),score=113.59 TRINITY_DN65830_c3_g2_i1:95-3235(+)